MPTSPASFALRMSPELKSAAKALTEVPFYEPSLADENRGRVVILVSINDAINSMIMHGLEAVLPFIKSDIEKYAEELSILQDILRFFMDNHTAVRALPVNFPEGSAARAYISEIEADWAEQLTPNQFKPGVDRGFAAEEFATCQHRLLKLGAAKGAILQARAACPEYRRAL